MDTFLVGFLGGVTGAVVVLGLIFGYLTYRAMQARKAQEEALKQLVNGNPQLAQMFGIPTPEKETTTAV